MEKVLNFIKDKKSLFIAGAILLLAVVIFLIIILGNKKITSLERVKINEVDSKVSNYLDEIYDGKTDDGKYINFAIEYLYNTTNSKEISVDKILDVINNTFDVKYSLEKIEKIGITETMLNKGLVYDSGKNVFKYNKSETSADIAHISITKYNLKKIIKKSNNKFVLEYEKYFVENPYKVLNYYSEKDPEITKTITDYLQGKSKVSVIKDNINSDNIKKVGKIDGKIKVTLIIKNNKLLIKQ